MLLFRPISSLYARLRKTSTYSFKQKNENERLHNGNSLVWVLRWKWVKRMKKTEGKKRGRSNMPDTHPDRQEMIKRAETKGSGNSSKRSGTAEGFLPRAWCLLNLYKHSVDSRANICSSKAVMTQHSLAADSNLFPETIQRETWPCMSSWLQIQACAHSVLEHDPGEF